MSAARPYPLEPPFPTDGRAHPEIPTRSDVQAVEDRGPDSDDYVGPLSQRDRFDFGEACELEQLRAEPEADAIPPSDRELLGDVLDLNEATAPFVAWLDEEDDEPDTIKTAPTVFERTAQ